LTDELAIRVVILLAKLGWNEYVMSTKTTAKDIDCAKEAIDQIALKHGVNVRWDD